jgi:hypothetical protein
MAGSDQVVKRGGADCEATVESLKSDVCGVQDTADYEIRAMQHWSEG